MAAIQFLEASLP
jgi:hypothetical protein